MKKKKRKNVMSLIACIASIWILSGYILPYITNAFATTRHLADYIDESGVETGQFYYTGVESTAKAEAGARASILFWEKRRSVAENE